MKNRERFFKNVDKKRSYTMSCIHSEETSIEKMLRSLLWKKGYRFRKNVKSIFGKPDIVFIGQRLLIFCDSSFWHGRNFNSKVRKIKTNNKYWTAKIKSNMQRDKEVNRQLGLMGWKVLRFWDKQIEESPEEVILAIEKNL